MIVSESGDVVTMLISGVVADEASSDVVSADEVSGVEFALGIVLDE